MKKQNLLIYTLLFLFIALIVAVVPTNAEGDIYEDTVRLHILANSDSEADQELKLEIRDRVLQKYGAMLSGFKTKKEATEKILSLTDNIKADAEGWCSELGYSYSCRVDVGTEWYDTREYEDFTLPMGYYTSLRIIIGEGEGRNWWCVMFPPMCSGLATEKAPPDDAALGYTDEEIRLIEGGGYTVKFKLLELLSSAVRQIGKKS